jgi:membrane associated rhomboid family serine protease
MRMGLENRDYYRDGRYTDSLTSLGLDLTPVVKYLILANVAVFLLQIFFVRNVPLPDPGAMESAIAQLQAGGDWTQKEAKRDRDPADDDEEDRIDRKKQEEAIRKARRVMERMMEGLPGMRISPVQEWLQLDPEKTIKQGQVWRLLTCAFCHSREAIWHIVFNMIFLFWFGTRLENMYGSREFLLFYLAAALASSLAYVGLAFWTGSNTPAIGASGAVMGVMMLYVIFYPFETMLLFWCIPVPLWVLLSLYVIFDLHPVLLALAGDRVFTGVAHAGHLGGLAFGFLYWKLGLRLEAPLERGGRPRTLPIRKTACPAEEPMILAHPQRDELNDQVDELLRKISEQGTDSLTEQERAILTRASAKYRGKR